MVARVAKVVSVKYNIRQGACYMLAPDEVVKLLEKKFKGHDKLATYIDRIHSMEQIEWEKFLTEKNINSLEDAENFVKELFTINENDGRDKFEILNDFVSYGIKGHTMHIHLVPSDIRKMMTKEGFKMLELQLINALEIIKGMLSEKDKFRNIDTIYAVSGLIRKPLDKIFLNLGFDVRSMKIEKAKVDAELSKFCETFKDKKYIGRARLGREILLSEEWEAKKDLRKSELEEELHIKNAVTLQGAAGYKKQLASQVNEFTIHDLSENLGLDNLASRDKGIKNIKEDNQIR